MIDKDKVLDKYHTSKINMAIKVKNLQIMFTLRRHYTMQCLGNLATKVPILILGMLVHPDIRPVLASYTRLLRFL